MAPSEGVDFGQCARGSGGGDSEFSDDIPDVFGCDAGVKESFRVHIRSVPERGLHPARVGKDRVRSWKIFDELLVEIPRELCLSGFGASIYGLVLPNAIGRCRSDADEVIGDMLTGMEVSDDSHEAEEADLEEVCDGFWGVCAEGPTQMSPGKVEERSNIERGIVAQPCHGIRDAFFILHGHRFVANRLTCVKKFLLRLTTGHDGLEAVVERSFCEFKSEPMCSTDDESVHVTVS